MMIIKPFAYALLALVLAVAPAFAAEGPQVEIKLAKELRGREPVDPGTTFDPGKIYCWNRITGGEGEFKVYHVWYKNGKQLWKQPVSAKGKSWVTWSFFNVKPGDWKVDVQDESGTVLSSAAFTVK